MHDYGARQVEALLCIFFIFDRVHVFAKVGIYRSAAAQYRVKVGSRHKRHLLAVLQSLIDFLFLNYKRAC